MQDEFIDEEDTETRSMSRAARMKMINKQKREGRVSVPGAIAGGVVNAAYIALILALPSLGLPFITANFPAVVTPLLISSGANIMSLFMRMGYSTYRINKFGKALESAGSAFAAWSLWRSYPFDFSTIIPGINIDSWLPTVFGVFAALGGIGTLVNVIKGIRGPKPKSAADTPADSA